MADIHVHFAGDKVGLEWLTEAGSDWLRANLDWNLGATCWVTIRLISPIMDAIIDDGLTYEPRA